MKQFVISIFFVLSLQGVSINSFCQHNYEPYLGIQIRIGFNLTDSISKKPIEGVVYVIDKNDDSLSYVNKHFSVSGKNAFGLQTGAIYQLIFIASDKYYGTKSILIDTRCSGTHQAGYNLDIEINFVKENYYPFIPLFVAYYNKEKDVYEYKKFVSYRQLLKDCQCCDENGNIPE